MSHPKHGRESKRRDRRDTEQRPVLNLLSVKLYSCKKRHDDYSDRA